MMNYLYGLGAVVAGLGGWWQYNRIKLGDTVVLKPGAGTPIKQSTGEVGNFTGNMPPLVVTITHDNGGQFFEGRVVGLMNNGRQMSMQEFSMLAPVAASFKDVSDIKVQFKKEDVTQNTTPRLF